MKFVWLVIAALSLSLNAQQAAPSAATTVPRLVNFSGSATDAQGKVISGIAGVTFAIYKEQYEGAPLWLETQNVQADARGHYTVQLGATEPDGLPLDLFTSGEARWLGARVNGGEEQRRVLLLSVPYALKAADAETIGGLPPSAFVLNVPVSSSGGGMNNGATTAKASAPAIANTSSDVTTTGGTVGAVPVFNTSTNIQNSILTQSGTTSLNVAGALKLPATGTATSTAGKNSQPQNFVASSFNSSTSTAENQTFQWRAEPASNDTTSPSGTLNLLYGLGATTPTETGLKLSSMGVFTFASGQTFPGTGTISGITTASGSGLAGGGTSGALSLNVPAAGITNAMLASSKITLNASAAGGLTTPGAMTLGSTNTIGLKTCGANQILQYSGTAWGCASPGTGTGTVTSVGSGAGLTGGPITTSGTLSVANAGVTNAMLQNSSVTVSAGSGLTGGGSVALGGSTSLSINTAVVPELAAANTFTNLQTINAANVFPALSITNTSGDGITISTSGSATVGVDVENAGLYGVVGTGNYQGGYFYGNSGGSYSENETDSDGAVAAYAYEFGTTKLDFGFWGYSASTVGVGVYGQAVQASVTGGDVIGGNPVGIWGDGGGGTSVSGTSYAVIGTADDGYGVAGYNDSEIAPTALFQNNISDPDDYGIVLTAYGSKYGGECDIDVEGNLLCTGIESEVAPVDGGARKVALNAVQSPEAWFEDAGSGQLSGGQAVVSIESVFGQTVNTGVEYHVFLTPNGDCKGLYVAEKSAASFVVKELGGGTSSIAFDYRIMAKRKSFENVRLTDVSKTFTIRNRPVRSAAHAKHLPSAQSIREQEQEHAKLRTAARLGGPVSNKKQ
jgi:hypothetical protein